MEDRLHYLGPIDKFDLIARCAEHGEPCSKPQVPCAVSAGMEIGGVPVICELGQGHAGRHVHTNGGHACWEMEGGYAIRAVVRDFTVGYQ